MASLSAIVAAGLFLFILITPARIFTELMRQAEQVEFQFEMLRKPKRKKTYRQRMLEAFDRDPIQCPCCKHTMLLVVIWHADYGRLYCGCIDKKGKAGD